MLFRSETNTTKTLTESAYTDYENSILQINFAMSKNGQKFDNRFQEADFFAINNTVIGYEWKNGQFIRMPFPTYLQLHNSIDRTINTTSMLIPLYNRYQSRITSQSQMDCPLHLQIISQKHFFGRFNRLDVELRSPCQKNVLYKVFLNRAGLREALTLDYEGRTFNFQFRTALNETNSANMTAEIFKEVRQVRPTHHKVNYLESKYLNEFMQSGDLLATTTSNGSKVTPKQLRAHQDLVIADMEAYYKKTEDFYKGFEKERPPAMKTSSIPANSVVFPLNSTLRRSGTEADVQADYNDMQNNFGLSKDEIKDIQKLIQKQISSLSEISSMCDKICTAGEYYYSWSFCENQCLIDRYYLSNSSSDSKVMFDVYNNSAWTSIGEQAFILRAKDGNTPSWTLEEIQKIWQSPPVSMCTQTWTRFKCLLI